MPYLHFKEYKLKLYKGGHLVVSTKIYFTTFYSSQSFIKSLANRVINT